MLNIGRTHMDKRWAISQIWMNGRMTIYTVATEEEARALAQGTKDLYKSCRVFVGQEIEQSSSMPEEDSDTK
jgi:hypothetical protein